MSMRRMPARRRAGSSPRFRKFEAFSIPPVVVGKHQVEVAPWRSQLPALELGDQMMGNPDSANARTSYLCSRSPAERSRRNCTTSENTNRTYLPARICGMRSARASANHHDFAMEVSDCNSSAVNRRACALISTSCSSVSSTAATGRSGARGR